MSIDLRKIGSDPDVFEAFYREHVEAVQRFVARRVGDREHAADLTADIFVAAIESAAGYRASRGSATAWLYGVARNVVAADRRARRRERDGLRRIVGHRLLDDDDAARMDARIDAAASARALYAAMDRLPEAQRAVVELVALDELSLAEAATVLRINPVAARVRLHRARHLLRDELSFRSTPTTAEVTP